MQFLEIQQYEELKEKYKRLSLNFKEQITSKRRCLITKGGTRTYLKYKNESILNMGMHEISLINQVSKSCKKALENGVLAPFNKHSSNYMCFHDYITEGEVYHDVIQIDINSAYLAAAQNRKYISQKLFDKFFEIEEDLKLVKSKANLPKEYEKQYITKDGEILRYSKKSRLIALGILAQNKTTTYYKAVSEQKEVFQNGGIQTERKYFNKKKSSAEFKTVDEYNEEHANIFFTCANDVDRCLLECIKNIDGVYFYWVDAIFCTPDAEKEVKKVMREHGFDSKTKEHAFLYKKGSFIFVQDSDNTHKKYAFSKYKLLSNIHHQRNIEKRLKSEVLNYDSFKNLSLEEKTDLCADFLETTKEKVSFFCKQTGYDPLQYMMYIDLCELLQIDSLKNFNLFYLCKKLNKLGMNYEHFLKIAHIQITKRMFNSFETIEKTVLFFHVEQQTKRKINVQEKNYFEENFAESDIQRKLIDRKDFEEVTDVLDFF